MERMGKAFKGTNNSIYTPTPASELEDKLLNNVGANILNDPVDSRIIDDYKNSKGKFIGNESEVGGYPTLVSVSRPADYDTDGDGMEDNWEILQGLNPNYKDDGKADRNGDGYTNLEEFLYTLIQ